MKSQAATQVILLVGVLACVPSAIGIDQLHKKKMEGDTDCKDFKLKNPNDKEDCNDAHMKACPTECCATSLKLDDCATAGGRFNTEAQKCDCCQANSEWKDAKYGEVEYHDWCKTHCKITVGGSCVWNGKGPGDEHSTGKHCEKCQPTKAAAPAADIEQDNTEKGRALAEKPEAFAFAHDHHHDHDHDHHHDHDHDHDHHHHHDHHDHHDHHHHDHHAHLIHVNPKFFVEQDRATAKKHEQLVVVAMQNTDFSKLDPDGNGMMALPEFRALDVLDLDGDEEKDAETSVFMKVDVNGDGVLTVAEWGDFLVMHAMQVTTFGRLESDVDHDDVIELREFHTLEVHGIYGDAETEAEGRIFNLMDRNNDKDISKDEWADFMVVLTMQDTEFSYLDQDKSLEISHDEFHKLDVPTIGGKVEEEAEDRIMHEMDTDADGNITKDEWANYLVVIAMENTEYGDLDMNGDGEITLAEFKAMGVRGIDGYAEEEAEERIFDLAEAGDDDDTVDRNEWAVFFVVLAMQQDNFHNLDKGTHAEGDHKLKLAEFYKLDTNGIDGDLEMQAEQMVFKWMDGPDHNEGGGVGDVSEKEWEDFLVVVAMESTDFSKLDENNDGEISLAEFVELNVPGITGLAEVKAESRIFAKMDSTPDANWENARVNKNEWDDFWVVLEVQEAQFIDLDDDASGFVTLQEFQELSIYGIDSYAEEDAEKRIFKEMAEDLTGKGKAIMEARFCGDCDKQSDDQLKCGANGAKKDIKRDICMRATKNYGTIGEMLTHAHAPLCSVTEKKGDSCKEFKKDVHGHDNPKEYHCVKYKEGGDGHAHHAHPDDCTLEDSTKDTQQNDEDKKECYCMEHHHH